MKKIIQLLVSLFVFSSIMLYVPFEHASDEHDHGVFNVVHVYAWGPGDIYGSCPNCPAGSLAVMDAFNPDCTNVGRLFVMCSNCGYGTDIYLPALGHDYNSSMTSQPTCTSNGTRVYTCTRCSSSYSESVSALGHSYNTVISKQATCLQAGEQISTCTRCGNSTSSVIPALGHSYSTTVTRQATCTQTGIESSRCDRCGDSFETVIGALGHNFVTTVTKAPTCTQTGIETTSCTRCDEKQNKTLKALGHNYKEEIVEPTCTEDGSNKKTCTRCNDTVTEVLKALGHDFGEETITKKATCEEDGLKESTCKRCNEKVDTVIPKLGHKYPEQWTIEKETGYFSEGLQSKTCSVCNNRIEEVIPRKDSTPLVLGGTGIAAVLGGIGLFFIKKKGIVDAGKVVKNVVEDTKEAFKPSFEDKTVVICGENEKYIDALKARHYLKVSTCSLEELKDSVVENEPDIYIVDIQDEEELNSVLELKEDEEIKETSLGLILPKKLIEDNKEKLESLRKDKQLVNYIDNEKSTYDLMVKLILPVLKPDFKSDESLENIGAIADVLGIPGISNVINVFVSGRDIKATLEEGELGVSGSATIISDIASILGYDTVSSVAGLVDDIDSIKEAINKEAGSNEVKGAYDAGKDIIEVVSDVINKD